MAVTSYVAYEFVTSVQSFVDTQRRLLHALQRQVTKSAVDMTRCGRRVKCRQKVVAELRLQ